MKLKKIIIAYLASLIFWFSKRIFITKDCKTVKLRVI